MITKGVTVDHDSDNLIPSPAPTILPTTLNTATPDAITRLRTEYHKSVEVRYNSIAETCHGEKGDKILSTPRIGIVVISVARQTTKMMTMTQALQIEYASRHGYDLHLIRKSLPRPQHYTADRRFFRTPHWQKIIATQQLFDHGHFLTTTLNATTAAATATCSQRPYDYLLWMDGDVVVMNLNITLESIIAMASPSKSIILSGDTNIVNSAQVIWKNNNVSRHVLHQLWEMVRPGCVTRVPNYENGMFSSMIGGCAPENTCEEKVECYQVMDKGYTPEWRSTIPPLIEAGNVSAIESSSLLSLLPVAPWALQHLHWVPKTTMNSYYGDFQTGHFVAHATGRRENQSKPEFIREMFGKSLRYHNLNKNDLFRRNQMK